MPPTVLGPAKGDGFESETPEGEDPKGEDFTGEDFTGDGLRASRLAAPPANFLFVQLRAFWQPIHIDTSFDQAGLGGRPGGSMGVLVALHLEHAVFFVSHGPAEARWNPLTMRSHLAGPALNNDVVFLQGTDVPFAISLDVIPNLYTNPRRSSPPETRSVAGNHASSAAARRTVTRRSTLAGVRFPSGARP